MPPFGMPVDVKCRQNERSALVRPDGSNAGQGRFHVTLGTRVCDNDVKIRLLAANAVIEVGGVSSAFQEWLLEAIPLPQHLAE
jgi:hypothetical protein